MEVFVRNTEGTVTDAEREYAAKKLGRLDRYFHQAQKVELVHRAEKLGHHIEITVFADGLTIRGEEHHSSLTAAIDSVHDKLERRLQKFKGRLTDRHRRNGNHVPKGLVETEPPTEDSEPHVPIVEHKHFLLKLMSIEEAALQMEMADLSFYVFRNEVSGNMEVLYRRRDGRYGMMHPEN